MHGVTTVFGGNCGFTLAPGGRRARRLPRAAHGARRGHPAPRARSRACRGTGRRSATTSTGSRTSGTAVNAGLPRRALRAAPRRDGRRRGRRGGHRRADHRRWNGCCTTRSTRARWASRRRRRRRTTTATAIRCRRARRRRDELLRLAGAVHSHPGTQLELIIPGCLNGFTDDEVDLMTAMSLAADRPAQLERARRHAAAACTSSSSTPARAPRRGARASSRSRCRRACRSGLSFLTGFVLDGLPGWRETFALPVPSACGR